MAAAFGTLTVTKQWADQAYHVFGTIVVTAGDYATGGIALNLNQADVKASRTPLHVNIHGVSGYDYTYVKGTDNSNGLLMVRAQKNAASNYDPLIELQNAAAIGAGVTGDTISFEGIWKGML